MQLYQADSTSCVNYLMLLSLQVISKHVELQGKSPPLEQQEQVWTDGVQTKLFLQSVLLLG